MTAPSDPGLCGRCRFARLKTSARGSAFLRCGRSDHDPDYLRYPPLPVLACPGFTLDPAGHPAGPSPRVGSGHENEHEKE